MRKLSFVSILSLIPVWLIGCGSSNKTSIAPPPAQPQVTTFAFMQGVDGQNGLFAPMIGTYTTTAGSTQFSAAAVTDPASGQEITGDFYSIVMSPDGKKAAVDLCGGLDRNTGQWDIWVANVDGSSMVQVTNDTNYNRTPQFSPDGTKVLFTSNRPSTGGNFSLQLVTRKIDGTGDQVLTLPMRYEGLWAPTYSPDGSKIAMEMWGVDTNNAWYDGIWVINADGSNPQMLTNPATADCNCHDQTPAFSSDGSQITFSRQDWSSGQEDVYIMNADGSAPTKLTASTGNSFEPMLLNIAGVGDRILFSSNRDNVDAVGGTGYELYSVTLDGNSLTRLTNNNLYDSFNFSFGGGTDCSGVDARVDSHRRVHE